MSSQDRFSMPRTFPLGSGFFGVSIIWALYKACVPVVLKDPPAAGGLIDGFGHGSLMRVLMLPAFLVVGLVRRGEASTSG
jgi:maltose/moltooligosaccharide transporter